MKRTIYIFLILLVTLSAAGCARQSPEEEVRLFLDGIKTKNKDFLMRYTDNEYINILLHSTGGDQQAADRIFENILRNLSYEILSSSENDNGMVVQVKIINADFTDVLKNYEKKSSGYIKENMYTNKIEKENLEAALLVIFTEETEAAASGEMRKESTVDIVLTKNDINGYDIVIENTLVNAVTGGLLGEQTP